MFTWHELALDISDNNSDHIAGLFIHSVDYRLGLDELAERTAPDTATHFTL
jgi:hypothetical protein